MGRSVSQPRNEIILVAPTPILIGAVRAKHQPYTIQKTRTALKHVPGPALIFRDMIAIGEATILGWLDRRYPMPSLFPADIETYARASTLAHALEADPSQAPALWAALNGPKHKTPFLLGLLPTIADLALWNALQLTDRDAAEQFEESLFALVETN